MLGRFDVDRAQAERVGQAALLLYNALNPEVGEEFVKRLHWAALMHEVGFAVSHSDYHKHSAYLIQHSDLAGFSTSDQERIATLVLGQRGNLRKVADALADRDRATKILALRLAVIFAHSRRSTEMPKWTLRYERMIEFGVDGEWLSRHPLTAFLIEEEAAQWSRVGVAFSLNPL